MEKKRKNKTIGNLIFASILCFFGGYFVLLGAVEKTKNRMTEGGIELNGALRNVRINLGDSL